MKRRYLSIMVALGVAISLFVGAIGTGGAQSTNLLDGDDAVGSYFPWVPYGHSLGDQGPFYGTVTVQNLSADTVDLYFFPGDPTGWGDPYVVSDVESMASTTATAAQIGLGEPGGAVRVHAVNTDVSFDDDAFEDDTDFMPISGSVKNVSPSPTTGTANTTADHTTVDGYSGMTSEQVLPDEHILPIVQTNSGWDTEIKLANFGGDGNVNYNITFYATGSGTGTPDASASGTIRAGEAIVLDIMDVVGIGPEWTGSAYISANASIGAVAERYKNVDSMLVTNTSRPAGPIETDGINNSVAPLVFQDYNFWNTGISVANLDENNWNDVQIDFYTPGGSLVGQEAFRIDPRGQKFLFAPGDQDLGLGGQIGAAIVRGTTDLHATVDQVKYLGHDVDTGNAMSYVTSALGDKALLSGDLLSVPLVQKGNPNTGSGDTSGIQYFNSNGTYEVLFDVQFYTTTGNKAEPTTATPLAFRLSSHQGATVYTHNYGSMSSGFVGSVVTQYQSGGGWLSAVSNNVNYDVNGDGSVAYQAVKIVRVGTDLEIEQSSAENLLGESHVVTATLFDQFGNRLQNEDVTINVVHENQADANVSNETLSGQTNSDGEFSITYVRTDGAELGDETIVAVHEDAGESEELTKTWDANIELAHAEDDTAVNPVGTDHTVIATVTDVDDNPVANAVVDFTVTGDGNPTPPTGSDTTDNDGEAEFTFTNDIVGTNQIVAELSATGTQSNTITKEWVNLLVNGDFEAFTGSLPDGVIAGDDSSTWYQWFAQPTWNIEDDGSGDNNIATQDPANNNQGGSIDQSIRQVIDGSLVPSGSTLEISFDYRSETTPRRVIVYGMTADHDWYQFPGTMPMGACGDGSDPNAIGFEPCEVLLDTTFGSSATFTSFSTTFPVNDDFVAIGVGIQLGGSTTGTDPRRAIDNVVLTFAP